MALTIAALAAGVLVQDQSTMLAASWVLLVGLLVTIPAIVLLPPPQGDAVTEAGH